MKTTTPTCIEQLKLKNDGAYLLLWRWKHIPVVYLTTPSVTLLDGKMTVNAELDRVWKEVGRVVIYGKISACAQKKSDEE